MGFRPHSCISFGQTVLDMLTVFLNLHINEQNMFVHPEVAFYHKMIIWRLVSSVAWVLLLMPLHTATFVILSRFPSFSECLHIFTSFNGIFALFVICEIPAEVALLNFQSYTVIPTVAHSKAILLCHQLHPRRFLSCLYHCAMGTLIAWSCASLANQRSLVIPCPHNYGDIDTQCLNDSRFVCLLAGGFVGFSYSLLAVIQNKNYVYFDTIQEWKLLRVCQHLPVLLKRSATHACYNVLIFIGLYSFIAHISKAYVCNALGLHFDSSVHSLHIIAELLNLPLLYHLWLSTTFLLYTWDFILMLFRVFVTEVYQFPLKYYHLNNITRVLSGEHSDIVKDLALLSQDYSSRCKEVLRICPRGGKAKRAAHTWLAVSKDCLSRLTTLNRRLNNYRAVATLQEGPQDPASINTSALLQFFQRQKEKLLQCQQEEILRTDGSTGRVPVLALFADCQAHIWAVEALSNFVKVCVDERRDNISRGSFHHIFCCMLDLKQAVDHHLSHSCAIRPKSCTAQDSYKTFPFVLQDRLQDAVKMMSYSLRVYLRELPMSAEHRNKLKNMQ